MARDMGISTTAECVETEEQMALASDQGCTEIQGYLICKTRDLISVPLPASELEEKFVTSERTK